MDRHTQGQVQVLSCAFAAKKLYGGGGGWWANLLQTLSQNLVLTLRFTFDPELDS